MDAVINASIINENFEFVEEACIIVEQGKIMCVHDGFSADGADFKDFLVIPGFVNAHTHIGDCFAKEAVFGMSVDEAVGRQGKKWELYEKFGKSRSTCGRCIIDTLNYMAHSATAAFADFREFGTAGVAGVRGFISGIPMDALILGRDIKIEDFSKFEDDSNLNKFEDDSDLNKFEDDSDLNKFEDDSDFDKFEDDSDFDKFEDDSDFGKFNDNSKSDKFEDNYKSDKFKNNSKLNNFDDNFNLNKFEDNSKLNNFDDNFNLNKFNDDSKLTSNFNRGRNFNNNFKLAGWGLNTYQLDQVIDRCERKGRILAIHAGEAEGEIEPALESDPDVLIHCTKACDAELEKIAKNNIDVVVCPRSNASLNVGIPEVRKMLDLGIRVGLGTDNVMINSPNMFREMEFLSKVSRAKGDALEPFEILRMATESGAGIFNLNFGKIKEGMDANLAFIYKFTENLNCTRDWVSAVVNRCGAQDVKRVMYRGRFVF